eukprot:gene5141-8747_t
MSSVVSPRGGKSINQKAGVITSFLSGGKEVKINEKLSLTQHNAIKKKQEDIFSLKEKIFISRNDDTLPDQDVKQNLNLLFAELRYLEQDLKNLRQDSYKELSNVAEIEKYGLKLPTPSVGQTKQNIRSSSVHTKEKSEKALQNWGAVLKVTQAASNFLNKWETSKKDEAEKLLSQDEIQKKTELTKEQILDLRSTLYRLNQKKNLTKKEELLKEKLLKKLKTKDETLNELK